MDRENLLFLKSQINERITSFGNRAAYYRKRSCVTYFSISILSAISAIILGLNLNTFWFENTARIIALIIASSISVISAYEVFFDNKQMWLVNNKTLMKLYKLSFDIEFAEKSNMPINEDMIENFRQEYQEILDETNKMWVSSRSK